MIALFWPLATLIAAAGLCVIAPRQTPGLYLWPVSCTAAFICLLAALAAAVIR
ncbi:hypothetical protein [Streptomyces sp. NPDC046909]|uniref:hypothetical protein n=1 Tax=Streptomyces sp. NPDC046909 TaxID=3155617 RepID=UPI0033C62171